MEKIVQDKTGLFNPTKELGNLSKYAAEKAFGKMKMWDSIERFTIFDYSTINMILEGTWPNKSDYIKLLSLCICRIRPRKVKLKKLPASLPGRLVIESLETGVEEDLSIYKNVLLELCRFPDITPQNTSKKGKKQKTFEVSSYYRQTFTRNNYHISINNTRSDFEYGITDT